MAETVDQIKAIVTGATVRFIMVGASDALRGYSIGAGAEIDNTRPSVKMVSVVAIVATVIAIGWAIKAHGGLTVIAKTAILRATQSRLVEALVAILASCLALFGAFYSLGAGSINAATFVENACLVCIEMMSFVALAASV